MAEFWEERWKDIRGNLLWAVLVWVFGGGMLTAIVTFIRAANHIPFEWTFSALVFLFSVMALALVMLLASREPWQRGSGNQQQSASLIPQSLPDTKALNDLFTGIDDRMRDELENSIRAQIAKLSTDEERITLLLRGAVVALVFAQFDSIWYTIFGSQLLALQRLNEISLRREDVFPFYTSAATRDPQIYSAYSFDRWIGYLRSNVLIREDGEMVSITVKGREFLKYIVSEGHPVNTKAF